MISTNIISSLLLGSTHLSNQRESLDLDIEPLQIEYNQPVVVVQPLLALRHGLIVLFQSLLIAFTGWAFMYAEIDLISQAEAIPPESIVTREQGLAQLNEPLPWIAGWDLDGRAQNVQKLLDQKPEEVRAVYVMLCHTQSSPCVENLRFLQSVRGVLESEGIDTILIFTEDIVPSELSTWLELRGVSPSPRFQVLIDRFHRSALRLGAYQDTRESGTLMRSNVHVQGRKSDQDAEQKRLHVPLGLLVSSTGKVMTIVVQGGADLVEHISDSLRYQAAEE